MRVNVYAEEMTDRIEIISKTIDGCEFTGLRFYLELPVTMLGTHGEALQHRGPFIHRPGDDDSSAVTFWGKRDLRKVLWRALVELDLHYDGEIGRPSFEIAQSGIPSPRDPIRGLPISRPEIVCLCGSTRFYRQFQEANYRLTMEGKVVLTVGFYSHAQEQAHGEQIGVTPEAKARLDDLHLRKIDLADRIFVLNVGGYIGESTGREIAYAFHHRKPITFLQPDEGRAYMEAMGDHE